MRLEKQFSPIVEGWLSQFSDVVQDWIAQGLRSMTDEQAEALCHALMAPKPAPKPETILEEANRIIYGDRAKSYGKACENHGNTGRFYEAWLLARYGGGLPKTDAYDVVSFNIGQKLARLAHALKTTGKIHRDSVVDLAGYAGNFDKIDKGE